MTHGIKTTATPNAHDMAIETAKTIAAAERAHPPAIAQALTDAAEVERAYSGEALGKPIQERLARRKRVKRVNQHPTPRDPQA